MLFPSFSKRIRLFLKSRRLARFRRTPRLVIPTPIRFTLIIPYKPIGVLLILGLIATSLYLLFRSDIFLVRSFEIKIHEPDRFDLLSNFAVKEELNKYLAHSIFFVGLSEIEKDLKKNFWVIQEVKVEKRLLDKIRVEIFIRKPQLLVEAQNGEFLLDREGVVLAPASISQQVEIPKVSFKDDQIQTGATFQSEAVPTLIGLIDGLGAFSDLKVLEISVSSLGEVRVMTSGPLILFDGKKELGDKFWALQMILKQSKMDGKKLARVDLRFDQPVVKY